MEPGPHIATASRHLQLGRPLDALQATAGHEDVHALAVRGIALAQLGDFPRAKEKLAAAAQAFERQGEARWAVKAMAALAEIALATRDLDVAHAGLDSQALRTMGDIASATYVDIQRARLLAMLGEADSARTLLAGITSTNTAPANASAILALAELQALQGQYAAAAGIADALATDNALLLGEARRLARELRAPVFTFRLGDETRAISLVGIEALDVPYVDTLRRRFGGLDLRRRLGQMELLAALARGPVTPQSLFGRTNESLAARLRVEISRLRQDTGLAVAATEAGFAPASPIGLLLPAGDTVEALLADGEAWPPRAIAATLGVSVRSVERMLKDHPAVEPEGAARSRRYRLRAAPGRIATQLLLLTRT